VTLDVVTRWWELTRYVREPFGMWPSNNRSRDVRRRARIDSRSESVRSCGADRDARQHRENSSSRPAPYCRSTDHGLGS
jgi:hypothetical protein